MTTQTSTTQLRVKKTSVISNPQLMQSYTALKNAIQAINEDVQEADVEGTDAEIDNRPSDLLQCPSLVVTGTQSAGKTTFIETLVGFPVGLTARGTGTRCPVRYILRPSASASHVQYVVDGLDCGSRHGLLDAVNRKMATLQRQAQFSDVPIVVEIHEPAVSYDMDIIDLPGLKTDDSPDQDDIVAIVKKYLSRHDVTPVVLTRALQSPENQHDMVLLKKNGLRLDKSILIVNGVNDTLRNIHDMSEVNAYFQEYIKWGKECKAIRFAMFHPTLNQSCDKEGMTPSAVEDFYNSLPVKEIEDLDTWLDSSNVRGGGSAQLDASVRGRFGVTNSHLALLDELQNWTKANGTQTAAALENRMPPLRASQRRIQQRIKEQTQMMANMDANITKYADKFLYAMDCIRKDVRFKIAANAHGSSFTGLINPLEGVPRRAFALTYADEFSQLNTIYGDDLVPKKGSAEAENLSVWKSDSELKQMLPKRIIQNGAKTEHLDTYTAKSLDLRLTCIASIRRLVKVVCYQIMKRPMIEFTAEDIMSKHRAVLVGDSHTASVIKLLIGDQVNDVFQEVFPRLLEHIRFLCERPMALAHSALAKGFQDIAQLRDFHHKLNDTYSTWLSDTLNAMNDHLLLMMKEKMTTFAVDIDTRLIQLLRLTPMEDRLDLLPHLVHPSSNDTELLEVKERENEVLNRGTNPGADFGHGSHKADPAYQAYLDVRNAVKNHNILDEIDFVEGGLTGVPTSEYREETKVVNEIGRKFWVQIKGLLVLELESKVEMYILEPLSTSRGSDDDLHQRIKNTVTEFMKAAHYQTTLKNNLGTAMLEATLDRKKDRQTKIEEALHTLNKHLHQGNHSRL